MNRIQPTSSHVRSWLRLLTCGCVTAAALIGTAQADDAEIYIPQTSAAPNIMLILDTSGSMQGAVTTQDAFAPDRDYFADATGSCAGIAGRVYFKTDNQGTPPSCDSTAWISEANLLCGEAASALASTGFYLGDRFGQWRKSTARNANDRRSWRTLTTDQNEHDTPVECRKDNLERGPYPDGTVSTTNADPQYSSSESDWYWLNNVTNGSSATLYSAKYVAYYAQFRNPVTSTRLNVMKQAATALVNQASNVNVGLMRYSVNTGSSNGGGMVLEPVLPIAENRTRLSGLINGLVAYGSTPLSETLYEAQQYFAGRAVDFGNSSQICTASSPTSGGTTTQCSGNIQNKRSVATSRVGGTATATNYLSPATESCQTNYIVYLTDGEPTSDNKADDKIDDLPGFDNLVGDCDSGGAGRCLGALAEYMQNRDLRGDAVSGDQNVTTYFIGFGEAFGTSEDAFEYLEDAAERGGGKAYKASDLSDLTKVFSDIFNSISQNTASMTAPTVAVNAFNRTRTLNDLYISVFQPKSNIHWPGNVKRYQIDPTDNVTVLARGGVDAIGTNGAFAENTSDYWSTTNSDGSAVDLGGAARKIPAPASRNLYTYIGANPTSSTAGIALKSMTNNNQTVVSEDNQLITDAILGTSTTTGADPTRSKLLKWARGADVDDLDEDNNVDEARFEMGDPMHSQPAVLIYGGTPGSANVNDAVVFTATNDGYLHAFATLTGEELWAFVPAEMLGGLKGLYENENSAGKNYAIDGDLRILKYDVNGDGIVNPTDNDRVLLFFSTGRNPTVKRYYALDVTSKAEPRFMWSIGEDVLPGLGQAWSRPTMTRVNVSGKTQNSQKLVLIFGGGYDPLEEGGPYVASTEVGNRLYMVDTLRGTLLWSAGADDADLELDRMTHSIPAPVNVIDLDGDGFADRMYVGDMAAQLWRFDIYNGKTSTELVTGGVIASLGARDAATKNAANTRRFYASPDVALLDAGRGGRPFFNIAIGSGYRGHPLRTTNEDRFYSIRDYRPYTMLTQEQFDDLDPQGAIVTDDDLADITTDLSPELAPDSPGWKLQLNDPSYQGEKALSSSTTLQNAIFFTTYLPGASATSNTCSVAAGSNRAYAISAFDGSPFPNRDGATDPNNPNPDDPTTPTRRDRYVELEQTGIAPEITTLFPDKDKVTCLSGVEVLSVCKDFNSRIKTYWRQTNAN